jgi:hypothetical protein
MRRNPKARHRTCAEVCGKRSRHQELERVRRWLLTHLRDAQQRRRYAP